MQSYQVIVDSSVWIDYFKKGNNDILDRLIEEDLICTNDLILTELIPFLIHQNHDSVVEELQAVNRIPLNIDWDIIREYQLMNLKNEINNVGIPDLIILNQVIQNKLTLFTFDKHFKLMQKHLYFELIE
ncbi:MAG: PIN domain-containing protein [Balneolaceae bacterium]|nr:PIN domain-containing protein [Balneolaceae bacterium]